jgi:thiamine biosynthesis protein ThiS
MGGRLMSELVITVNGESRMIPYPATLTDLLQHLDLDPRAVIVELNREIIRRPRLAETWLTNGDTVEVVHFVGGG